MTAVKCQCDGGGGYVVDTVNNVCYTYHSTAKTRQDAADSCSNAGSQLVSVQVSYRQSHSFH